VGPGGGAVVGGGGAAVGGAVEGAVGGLGGGHCHQEEGLVFVVCRWAGVGASPLRADSNQGLLYTGTDFLPNQISKKGQNHISMQIRTE